MGKMYVERKEKEKVHDFLMGLNETYFQICGFIFLMSPLPDAGSIHGMPLRQEKQLEVVAQ